MRLGAVAGSDALGAAIVEDAHGAAGGGPREVRGDHALGRRSLLGAEAAAHELARDVHAVGIELECPRELGARVPDALRRHVGVQLVAQPLRDAAVRLERVVHLGGGGVLGLDDHVGLGHAGLDVARLVLDRILLQPLLGQSLGGIGDEAEHRVARRERLDAGARRLGRLAGERRDRRAGVRRLALEDRVAALHDVVVGRREHREHARHGARSLDVELDRRVRVRRAHDHAVQHARQRDVGDVARGARDPARAGQARDARPRHVQLALVLPGRRLLLDEHPALLEAALHLDRRLLQLGHQPAPASSSAARSTARSMPG